MLSHILSMTIKFFFVALTGRSRLAPPGLNKGTGTRDGPCRPDGTAAVSAQPESLSDESRSLGDPGKAGRRALAGCLNAQVRRPTKKNVHPLGPADGRSVFATEMRLWRFLESPRPFFVWDKIEQVKRKWRAMKMNINWLKDPDHVAYCEEETIVPRLARELGISDLGRRVAEFRRSPVPEGVNIKGLKRTTLKMFIPNLMFQEPIDMGENVWLYMGELCPAYCLYTPWEKEEG